MYKVVLSFNRWEINNNRITEILENIPIKNKSNGSLVSMKNDDPWLDYINVSIEEIYELFKYIDELKCKDINMKIQFKE